MYVPSRVQTNAIHCARDTPTRPRRLVRERRQQNRWEFDDHGARRDDNATRVDDHSDHATCVENHGAAEEEVGRGASAGRQLYCHRWDADRGDRRHDGSS